MSGDNEPRSLTRGAAILASSHLGTNALGLLSGIALARGLGADQRGVMQYAALYFTLAPLVLGLSLGTVFASYGKNDAVPFRGYWRFAIAASVVASIGALSLLGTGLPTTAAIVLAAGSLAYMTSDALVGLANRSERFGLMARIRWFNQGGNSALVVMLYAAGLLSVTSAVVTLIVLTALATGIGWTRQPQPAQQTPLWGARRHIAHTHGVRLAGTATSYLDQILVAVFLSSATLGVFTVAVSLARQINILPIALQSVLLEAARRDAADGRRRLEPILSLVLWTGIVAAAGALLIGETFFSVVFGEEFKQAGLYAPALMVTGTAAGALILVEAYLTGMHQPGYALRARAWALPFVAVAAVGAAVTGSVWVILVLTGLMNAIPLLVCLRRLATSERLDVVQCLVPRPREAWRALRARS